jgi:hypothetical protein
MQQQIFGKKTVLSIDWDVISFQWFDNEGNYCVYHYWKDNFTVNGWWNLMRYATLKKKYQKAK